MMNRTLFVAYVAVIFSVMFSTGCHRQGGWFSDCTGRKTLLPDYKLSSSYGVLGDIEPAGYFKVGRRYIHAPKVEFVPVEGACCYEILLLQNDRILGVTKTDGQAVFAEKGWEQIKLGKAGIAIVGYDMHGKRIALSRLLPFYAAPDFSVKASACQYRSYQQAAVMAFHALRSAGEHPDFSVSPDAPASGIKNRVVLSYGVCGNKWVPLSFPNLHAWIYVEMVHSMNRFADESLKKELEEFACSVGDYLLMCRMMEDGYKYKGMIRTCTNFNGEAVVGYKIESDELRYKMMRLIEPAKCGYSGKALVGVYRLTNEKKYLDAAIEIAEVLFATQLDNGSWYARVDGRTGEPLGGTYSTSVAAVATFMDNLNEVCPDTRWTDARDKALRWLSDNPFKTYGWVVNFDDGPSQSNDENPYAGLSNWDLFEAIRYLADNPRHCAEAKSIVNDQLRWNDNHFVFYGSDPLLSWEPFYPVCGEQGDPGSFSQPSNCWIPMDFHTGNWGTALLAAYELNGDRSYLVKAIYAANALTQYQLDDGKTFTWMPDKTFGISGHTSGGMGSSHSFWPAGWAMSAYLWSELVHLGYGQ